MFSSFSCSLITVGDSCSHQESLSRTVLRNGALVASQEDDVLHKSWPGRPPSSMMNSGRAYANPELGMGIQWKILARQKAHMGIYSHPIVWRGSTTKGSERLRQKNMNGKREKRKGEKRWTQRDISRETKEGGVDTMQIAAPNRRERGRRPGTTSWTEETAAENKTKSLEKAWN